MWILFVLPILILGVSGDVTKCPEGWQLHEGYCYGVGEQGVPWAEAQAFCSLQGGKLVELNTDSKNTYVKSLAAQKNLNYVWVGGMDIFDEGNWIWSTTGEHILATNDWYVGQPADTGVLGEDCMYMYKGWNYQWSDGECNKHYTFICEANSCLSRIA